jgi:hypothetical protein
MNTEPDSNKPSDYDSAWKDVIEELFKYFLQFFYPHIHDDIDFDQPIEFLSEELRQIMPDGNIGKRVADVLVKVHLKDGTEKCICIFIHIEVQGQPKPNFMQRMYIYNYRSFDRYEDKDVEVISLAILTDESRTFRPDEYRIDRWGFELRMKIPIVKIIDYKYDEAKRKQLETSINPMALVVDAQLKSFEAKKGDNERKYGIKWNLMRECYKKGYSKDQTRTLMKFVDWIIRLPDELQEKLNKEIIRIEEEYKMPYVPSWERNAEKRGEERGEERGEKRGEKRGVEIGEKKGIKKAKLETARRMLNEGLNVEVIRKCTGLTEKEIKALMH